jgi:hypothetical protein
MITNPGGAVVIGGMALKNFCVLSQARLEPQAGLDFRGGVGEAAQVLDSGVDTRQMLSPGPTGNDILDKDGDFLGQAAASRMDDSAVA